MHADVAAVGRVTPAGWPLAATEPPLPPFRNKAPSVLHVEYVGFVNAALITTRRGEARLRQPSTIVVVEWPDGKK